MPRLRQSELDNLNQTFEQRTPIELLEWALATFGDRLAGMSSMQKAGNVICHMLHSAKLPIKVLFVDTGVLFQETLDTRDRLRDEYGLEIVTLTPEQTMEQQTREKGILYLSPEGQMECCDLRKSEPLRKVADQYDAIIGSLRRSDGGRRADVPILALDRELNCLRVNVLANFDDAQMKEYIETHQVITNPLHEQGYATIGCNRCTTPVLESEPKRAGRWRHLGPWSMYCGINPTDLGGESEPWVELSQDLIDSILGQKTDFMI